MPSPYGSVIRLGDGCHVVTGAARRARLEVADNSIDKSVSRLQSADACVIIDIGGLRRDNISGIPTPQPPQSRPTEPVRDFDKQFPIVRTGPPTEAPALVLNPPLPTRSPITPAFYVLIYHSH